MTYCGHASRAQFETRGRQEGWLQADGGRWFSGYMPLNMPLDPPPPLSLNERYADFVSRLSTKMGEMK
jgi:hypothetical protein